MSKTVWLAAFVILLSTVAMSSPQVAVLDGTSWKVDVEPDTMAKDKGEKQYQGEPWLRSLPEGSRMPLRELIAHLREKRTELRKEWVRRITDAGLLAVMGEAEVLAETIPIYDNYVEALDAGTSEALQAHARSLSERIIPRGVGTDDVVGIVLLLGDVLARSLFAKYHNDPPRLNRILDAYGPSANRIVITVALGFVQERERTIREQQKVIQELSAPVLQVREGLLILPISGVIDPHRAHQLAEQLLSGIRTHRAKVVVIDITGVAAMDSRVADQLVRTVESSRQLGPTVIVTGLSPEIAQTLASIGVDPIKITTGSDLPFEMTYRAFRESSVALRLLNERFEEEAKRIAHALHAEASQLLVSAYLALEAVSRELPSEVRHHLSTFRSLLDQISEQIRGLSHELRPTILDDLGLLPALRFLAEGVSARSRIPVTVEGQLEARPAPAVETAIYRAVQEALNNTTKHARATGAVVHVLKDHGRIVCSVRDDGAGFERTAVFDGNGTGGIGLMGIRERLHSLGGTLQINSSPGRGTNLIITVPAEG